MSEGDSKQVMSEGDLKQVVCEAIRALFDKLRSQPNVTIGKTRRQDYHSGDFPDEMKHIKTTFDLDMNGLLIEVTHDLEQNLCSFEATGQVLNCTDADFNQKFASCFLNIYKAHRKEQKREEREEKKWEALRARGCVKECYSCHELIDTSDRNNYVHKHVACHFGCSYQYAHNIKECYDDGSIICRCGYCL